jgi:hypothetical protein
MSDGVALFIAVMIRVMMVLPAMISQEFYQVIIGKLATSL